MQNLSTHLTGDIYLHIFVPDALCHHVKQGQAGDGYGEKTIGKQRSPHAKNPICSARDRKEKQYIVCGCRLVKRPDTRQIVPVWLAKTAPANASEIIGADGRYWTRPVKSGTTA